MEKGHTIIKNKYGQWGCEVLDHDEKEEYRFKRGKKSSVGESTLERYAPHEKDKMREALAFLKDKRDQQSGFNQNLALKIAELLLDFFLKSLWDDEVTLMY